MLISMNQAVRQGLSRVRDPKWAYPDDYVRIDIFEDGNHGPWVHLFSRGNALLGKKNPQDLLFTMFDWDAVDCEAYTGTFHAEDDGQETISGALRARGR